MSDRDPQAEPIGAEATDVDQAVTPIDTPVDERGDGETRPRENTADACPVIHTAPGADRANHGGQPHPTVGTANQVWWPRRSLRSSVNTTHGSAAEREALRGSRQWH